MRSQDGTDLYLKPLRDLESRRHLATQLITGIRRLSVHQANVAEAPRRRVLRNKRDEAFN